VLGSPAEVGDPGSRFDLVTAWDVLEHVHDPLPFLESLAAVLAPGGRVFIRTPNLSWILPTYAFRRHLISEQIELGPLNHVVYYTAPTLRRALLQVGLDPIAWPVLPPPQVGFGNRDPSHAGRRTAVTIAKNAYARSSDVVARASGGKVVAGADLDVVAMKCGDRPEPVQAVRGA
jgi:SAM-dependent methyltransferase